MKFNARTIAILRNFSTIHQALQFKEGNVLKTMSETKSILAKATIDTEIEKAFAIYDVPKFLSAISMFEDPELIPHASYVEIAQNNERIEYTYSEPSLIKTPPEKEIVFPKPDVTLTLKNDDINRVLKGMGITGANAVCITGENGKIYLESKTVTLGPKSSQSNVSGAPSYRAEVGATEHNFCFVFTTENIKLMPGDYVVSLSKKGISHFKGTDVEYWISMEQTSTFDG
jgi:hypothetical protein